MTAGNRMFLEIIFACFVSVIVSEQTCTTSDVCTILCKDTVPVIVQTGVTRVFIELIEFSSYYTKFEDTAFTHRSWLNITVLDFTVKFTFRRRILYFDFPRFGQLHNLKELRIHGNKAADIVMERFPNISHLALLEFSNCEYSEIKTLIQTLLTVNTTVHKLLLNAEKSCYVDGLFVELLQKKQVYSLSLRNAFTVIGSCTRIKEPINLKELDFSEGTVKFWPETGKGSCNRIFEGLTTLNVSSTQDFTPHTEFWRDKTFTNCSQLYSIFQYSLFMRLENMYANDIFKVPVVINNTLLNITHCIFNLKRWHFRNNHIQYFNISMNLPLNNKLKEVDISNNEIKYVSPWFLHTATSLEVLNLERNELFNMENFPDFRDILVSLRNLKYLSLADNKISHLPLDVLRHNEDLKVLDLSDNDLKTVTFTMRHLKNLRTLKLGGNDIKFLEGNELANVQVFLKHLTSLENSHNVLIELARNPLECSCESVQFMKWVILVVQLQSTGKYHCTMEDEEKEINEESLKHAKFLCYRTTIIVCTPILIMIPTVGSFLLTAFVRRRKRTQLRKCAKKAFLNDFLKGTLREKYLCQISYANEDEMCVLNFVHAKLGNALTEILDTRGDFICTGDRHFCLGRPIVDEILRCISESCVLIFIISKSFCKSRWCEMELREAYEMENR